MDIALAELIQRTREGDQDAFGVLFERYKNLVYRTAYLMLGEAEEAEDALQEIFLKVYRSLSSYQPTKGAFTTWLYRITTNYCLNQRRIKRFYFVPLEWVRQDNNRAAIAKQNDPGEDQDMHLALEGLSDKLRAVIVLRYYGGLSYAEIGESLNIPIGTVKSRLDLGFRKLRRELDVSQMDWFSGKEEIAK